ncbi:MAG TPA: hypothetical protein VI341_08175 [Actinomycetota bacterium]
MMVLVYVYLAICVVMAALMGLVLWVRGLRWTDVLWFAAVPVFAFVVMAGWFHVIGRWFNVVGR